MSARDRNAYAERKAAIAAVDRMHRERPLRPPPTRIEPPRVTAAAAELAREIRAGTYTPPRARLFGGDS